MGVVYLSGHGLPEWVVVFTPDSDGVVEASRGKQPQLHCRVQPSDGVSVAVLRLAREGGWEGRRGGGEEGRRGGRGESFMEENSSRPNHDSTALQQSG